MKTVYTSTNEFGDALDIRAWQYMDQPIVSLGAASGAMSFSHRITPAQARELAAALLTAADEAEVKE
mgnify:CR=1 FL=1